MLIVFGVGLYRKDPPQMVMALLVILFTITLARVRLEGKITESKL